MHKRYSKSNSVINITHPLKKKKLRSNHVLSTRRKPACLWEAPVRGDWDNGYGFPTL